jgi:hypothetical protein
MGEDEPAVGGRGKGGAALRAELALPEHAAEEQAQRLLDGTAWREFCRSLEQAGEHLCRFPVGETPVPGELRAEGFRYLLGLVSSGILQATQLSDPDQPRFVRNPDSSARWGAENVDNQYLWARIRPDASYRVEGLRRSAFEFLVEVKDGYMQLGNDRVFSTLLASELAVEPDGGFEILLSRERPAGYAGNWMPLPPAARYVSVRQYLVDWEREEPARFEIFRIGGEGEPAAPLTPDRMAELLDEAGLWTLQTARFWSEWVEQLRNAYVPGQLKPPRSFVGGAPGIVYGNDWWVLGPDEAMLVESELPEARYWQIQLCDAWFRSFDYVSRQTGLNSAQAHIGADAKLRCVIAHRDPGIPNWLDTCGHPEGMIQYRWIWTKTKPLPEVRMLPFDAVRDALPSDTPHVSPAERRRATAIRQCHIQRREPAS